MPEFLEFYVRTFAVVLPVIAVAIFMVGAMRAEVSGRSIGLAIAIIAGLLGAWFAASIPLAQTGAFNVPPTPQDPPVVLAFLLIGAIALWALAWLTPLGHRVTMATPLSAIAAFQIPRVMGGVFLIGWLYGSIPAAFAIPAGLGDIWAGIAGYQASVALANGAPNARRLLFRANIIGIGDFVMAVVLGIMTSEGFAHLLSRDAPNIINDYPLALFPAFFVPIFLGFHFISLSRLRADRKANAQATTSEIVA